MILYRFITKSIAITRYDVLSPYTFGSFAWFLAKNRSTVFSRFRFFIQKIFIALHITFVENDQTYFFASKLNGRTIHQMDNIVMFVYKLAVYVMQLLHIKTQIMFHVALYSDLLMMWKNGADKHALSSLLLTSIPVWLQL